MKINKQNKNHNNLKSHSDLKKEILSKLRKNSKTSQNNDDKDLNINKIHFTPSRLKTSNFYNSEKKNLYVLGLILFILILVSICLFAYKFFNSNKKDPIVANSLQALADTDKFITNLDSQIEVGVDDFNEDTDISQDNVDQEKYNLKNTIDELNKSIEISNLQSSEYNTVPNIISSCRSRIEMIDKGYYIYNKIKETKDNIKKADEFWDNLMYCNELMHKVDELASSSITENLNEAVSLNSSAINLLEASLQDIDYLTNKQNNCDFSKYRSYCTLKIEAVKASYESLQLLLSENTQEAFETNNKYVEIEGRASDQVSHIENPPSTIIRTVYDIDIKPYIDSYVDARKEAALSDSFIRD